MCLLQGRKSELEKFAGAMFTTSVEGFVPATGKGVQVRPCSRLQRLQRITAGTELGAPHVGVPKPAGRP